MRTMDVAFINWAANHPDIRPFVGLPDAGPLDMGPAISDPRNICYRLDHGAFLFMQLDPGRYELHTMIAPEGRGAAVLPASREAFRYMFVETDCAEIVTKVPSFNRRADLMARRAGFQDSFTRKGAWDDGSDVAHLTLSLDQWRAGDDVALAQGRTFHKALEAAKTAAGSTIPAHADDEAHDRAAGLSCLMAKVGNYRKAVWAYSRWARFAGYQTIELVSDAPVVIDVRDALVTVRNGEMEVLTCRQ